MPIFGLFKRHEQALSDEAFARAIASFRSHPGDRSRVIAISPAVRLFELRRQWQAPVNDDACVVDGSVVVAGATLEESIGEFAWARWNEAAQQLEIGRDATGCRPLYYSLTDDYLAVSTDPEPLFAAGVDDALDPEVLARYLIVAFNDSSETEFMHVKRLRPGFVLKVSAESASLEQYWDVGFDPRVYALSEEAAAAELAQLLDTVIESHVATGADGALLSGGFDSSSVVSIAESQRGARAPLDAYCARFADRARDESRYMKAVGAKWGTKLHWVDPKEPSPIWSDPEAMRPHAQPLFPPTAYLVSQCFDAAKADGTKVLLTGIGGDEFFDPGVASIGDLIERRRYISLVGHSRKLAAFYGEKYSRFFRGYVIRPLLRSLLPELVVGWMKRMRPEATRGGGFWSYMSEPFRSAAFASRGRPAWHAGKLAGRPVGTKSVYSSLYLDARIRILEWWSRAADRSGVEIRSPLSDRRVVEFLASLPSWRIAANGIPKGLLRLAVEGRLPVEVASRSEKTDFTESINRAMIVDDEQAVRQLLESPELARMNIIDASRIIDEYNAYQSKYKSSLNDAYALNTLWPLLSLEAWLHLRNEQRKP